jgi:hypothetical protein
VTSLFDAVLATPGASADLIDRDGSAIAALKHWAHENGHAIEVSGHTHRVRVGVAVRITVIDMAKWNAANDEQISAIAADMRDLRCGSPAQGGAK